MLKLRKFNNLYIHVPFCRNKCDYCAFYSTPSTSEQQINHYFDCLKQHLISSKDLCAPLDSIYIGGGTPTYFNEEQLEHFFTLLKTHCSITGSSEVSIECNPETITTQKAETIASFANRVSIGVQSFNDQFRLTLGRSGDVDSVSKAINIFRSAQIKNLSIDLIYAIPGQNLSDWKLELQKTVDLGVQHISAYALTIEEGTKLANNNTPPVDDSLSSDMWLLTQEFLESNNYYQYEISNYSQPGYECRHNQNIWHGDSYLGLGPAACSFNGVDRWTEESDIAQWLHGVQPEIDSINTENRNREIFVMGLRTVMGWQYEEFKLLTGVDYNSWSNEISHLINEGLLEQTESNISPTAKGLLFWDSIAETLIISE